MKRQIQDTSLQAYFDIDNLPEKRRVVYEAIKELGEACNLEIARHLNLPINCVTPRTNELVKLGLVTMAKKDITHITGKMVMYWEITGISKWEKWRQEAIQGVPDTNDDQLSLI